MKRDEKDGEGGKRLKGKNRIIVFSEDSCQIRKEHMERL